MLNNLTLCLDAVPNFMNLFDTTVAPPLLFYSYIPILFITLLFSLFVLRKDKSIKSKLLFAIALSFSFWIINILVQWTAIHANFVHFAWQLTGIFEISIFLLSVYFVYAYLNNRDISNRLKIILTVLALPVIILLPTVFNVDDFDLVYCQSTIGNLWGYIYVLEVTSIIMIAYIGLKSFLSKDNKTDKLKVLFPIIGTILFLSIFFLSNFIAEINQVYEINLFGPIGALLFLIFFSYSIIKFHTFNIRMLKTQALVVGLWVLVFSLLFVHEINQVRTIVILTLVILTIVGALLVRAVRLEHEQRERIEDLAKNLKVANEHLKVLDKQKSEFVSLASHQLRSPLGSIRGYISLIAEGEFGKIPEDAKEPLVKVQSALNDLVALVSDYLDVTRIELGKLEYSFEKINFTEMVEESFNYLKPSVEKSGLKFDLQINNNSKYIVRADRNKIKQVITNLVDNSAKYTQAGSVTMMLEEVNGKVRFSVKDTGIGLSEESKKSLFQKFTRVDSENNQNIKGTGLGLFIARKIVESHEGKIWVESEGKDKGSSFIFELPLSKI